MDMEIICTLLKNGIYVCKEDFVKQVIWKVYENGTRIIFS
jgi:hypothetical protein